MEKSLKEVNNKTKKITFEVETFIKNLKPKVCSLAYVSQVGDPIVCQMGFALFEDDVILHTNTWTRKWKEIQDGQKIALCIGFEHLTNYIQLQGIVKKIFSGNPQFGKLEKIYLQEHQDAENYKVNQEGIFLVVIEKLRFAIVKDYAVRFEDFTFN